ncbi:hypothetical protein Tco_0487434 [Tanacetum coccineum]
MLLPKEDNVNTGKHGLSFENQNNNVNPSVLNKVKELAPYLYNIDEMGKDELSDHKIILEEELKCEAEKCLKVKQRKSPLSYHGFVYYESQFEEPPKVPLKRRNVNLKNHLEQIQNIKEHLEKSQLRDHDPNLWNNLPVKYFCYIEAQSVASEIALQHKIQENNSLETMQTEYENFMASLQIENAHLKKTYKDLFESIQNSRDETNQCDDVKLKFDFDEIETQNIEVKHQVASLIKENEHLKLVYKNLFDSIKKSQLQTQSTNVSQNEAENLKSQLSDFADKKFNNVFQKIESLKKKKKNILFGNDTSSFQTNIKELEMTLSQQTKDLEDAKVDFSKKTYKFETSFEKLEKTKVVLERQLDRKIQDSNGEKDQFLKQIASLESKLASQYLISNQKEYSDLRTSYNALKVKFDSLNRDKGKSPVSNYSTPKVSVSSKFYTGESSKSFPKRVSQFTTYSLQKDRKFYKKP